MNDIRIQTNKQRSEAPTADALPEEVKQRVIRFHKSLPGYESTPLASLKGLAGKMGIEDFWVKSEAERFGLKAFKVLGASYAIARVMAKRFSMDRGALTFEGLIKRARKEGGLTFVTATDGNHGRAVAWTAEKLGCRAVVYMPKGSSPSRLEAVRNHGADASIIDGNYDDAVRLAAGHADEKGWILLQDTSWPGYEEIPDYIVQGYATMMVEAADQLKGKWPTHVFVQAGVGSLATAMLCAILSFPDRPRPWFGVVEPEEAACFFKSISINDGERHAVRGDMPTIMAGLACGEPSLRAWEILKNNADAFILCPDYVAERGMQILARPAKEDVKVVSGESGAVTTGLVHEIMARQEHFPVAAAAGLSGSSRVLVFSTEGDTDPEFYKKVVDRTL
jgi:diaminopropionate ammonia-lyase